jgi:hypothetical protein
LTPPGEKLRNASCAAALAVGLAGTGTLAVASSDAQDPAAPPSPDPAAPPATYQGKGVRWWADRAVRARRDANMRRRENRKLQLRERALTRELAIARRHWKPTIDYALQLAAAVYGISEIELRNVAWCESRLSASAQNGQYRGLFQQGPMFEQTAIGRAGFSVWDPVAAALSTAATVEREGWAQWECKP